MIVQSERRNNEAAEPVRALRLLNDSHHQHDHRLPNPRHLRTTRQGTEIRQRCETPSNSVKSGAVHSTVPLVCESETLQLLALDGRIHGKKLRSNRVATQENSRSSTLLRAVRRTNPGGVPRLPHVRQSALLQSGPSLARDDSREQRRPLSQESQCLNARRSESKRDPNGSRGAGNQTPVRDWRADDAPDRGHVRIWKVIRIQDRTPTQMETPVLK